MHWTRCTAILGAVLDALAAPGTDWVAQSDHNRVSLVFFLRQSMSGGSEANIRASATCSQQHLSYGRLDAQTRARLRGEMLSSRR